MSTYINQIVQLTRQLHTVDSAITLTTPTAETTAEYERLMAARYDLVLTAIRAGVDPDLIQWAIGINDHPAKVQIQFSIAAAAADAA